MNALPLSLDLLPWLDDGHGVAIHLLHGGDDDATRAMLLRVQPGVVVGRHRHEGEVHVIGLAGTRELLDTGRRAGPGDYVHEPAGNLDNWRVVGDEPVVLFLTARGAIEYLDEDGAVRARSTTGSITAAYRALLEAA